MHLKTLLAETVATMGVGNTTDTVYHVTPAGNVPKIMKRGLEPRIGSRSKSVDEPTPFIYVWASWGSCLEALSTWLGLAYRKGQKLSILELTVPDNWVEFSDRRDIREMRISRPVPPGMIKLVVPDTDRLDFGSTDQIRMKGPRWPRQLNGAAAVADYLTDYTDNDYDVDPEVIENLLGWDCRFRLEQVPLDRLKPSPHTDHHIRVPKRIKKFMSLDPSTMPPILVHADGTLIDGHHRFEIARAKQLPSMLAYVEQTSSND